MRPIRTGLPDALRPAPGVRESPFCDWLEAQLRSSRISQRQLAMRAGVHHSTISRLIRHRRTPSLVTAVRLAQVLDPTGASRMPIARPTDPRMTSPMRVEHALRADPTLSPTDVRDLMRGYLRRRGRHLVSAEQPAGPRAMLEAVGRR
jgi:transcriptional regulator with XRE-family HTH domain